MLTASSYIRTVHRSFTGYGMLIRDCCIEYGLSGQNALIHEPPRQPPAFHRTSRGARHSGEYGAQVSNSGAHRLGAALALEGRSMTGAGGSAQAPGSAGEGGRGVRAVLARGVRVFGRGVRPGLPCCTPLPRRTGDATLAELA